MEGYNGWKNYQTWDVALWLDNDYGTYCTCRELAALADGNQGLLADFLKDFVQEMIPDEMLKASMYVDLLQHAISEVDWLEIAEHYMED